MWKVIHTNCLVYRPEVINHATEVVLHIDQTKGNRADNAIKYIEQMPKNVTSIIAEIMMTAENDCLVEEFMKVFGNMSDQRVKVFLKYPLLAPDMNVVCNESKYDLANMIGRSTSGGHPRQARGVTCTSPDNLIVVNHDGSLMLGCCSPDPVWDIGTIDDGILNVFNSKKVRGIVAAFPNIDPCKNCIEVSKRWEKN